MPDFIHTESLFFEVLGDLKEFLDDLTLVGGWLPYVYTHFLWNNIAVNPVTTVDIDFGFDGTEKKMPPLTIFEKLSPLDYTERHFKIGKTYPVTLSKKGELPIDFITNLEVRNEVVEQFVGRQMTISKVDKFDFLLKHRMSLSIKRNKKNIYKFYCPKPSAFLYHKGETFIDREDEQKQAKELQYIYFILRYIPDIDTLFKEVAQYIKEGDFKNIADNLHKYFKRVSSEGCLMVEKENGSDEYVDDLRQDIFERFRKLRGLF